MEHQGIENTERVAIRMERGRQELSPVQFAAAGMVLMQVSVAVTLLGAPARVALLAAGLALVGVSAFRSIPVIGSAAATQVLVLIVCGAAAFELLSWFNAHNVFEPKLIAFRLICYFLFAGGALAGLATAGTEQVIESSNLTTATVGLIAFGAPITWLSLDAILAGEGVRGSFDESSPVALGFSSGALAIAALVVALRSPRLLDYSMGIAGYAGWLVVCMQSGSRGALLSVVLASLIVSGLSFAQAPKRVLALLLLAVMFITGRVALGESISGQATYVLERFESILSLEADASIAGSADSRAYLLDHNLNLPGIWLLGGEGYDPQAYPHNFEVEALVRLGAPLALVFVASVIYLLWRMVCLLRPQGSDIGVAIVFGMGLFTFFNAQTNMMWEFLRPLWLSLGLVFGMVVAQRKMVSAADS